MRDIYAGTIWYINNYAIVTKFVNTAIGSTFVRRDKPDKNTVPFLQFHVAKLYFSVFIHMQRTHNW